MQVISPPQKSRFSLFSVRVTSGPFTDVLQKSRSRPPLHLSNWFMNQARVGGERRAGSPSRRSHWSFALSIRRWRTNTLPILPRIFLLSREGYEKELCCLSCPFPPRSLVSLWSVNVSPFSAPLFQFSSSSTPTPASPSRAHVWLGNSWERNPNTVRTGWGSGGPARAVFSAQAACRVFLS